ncbi:PIF1 [Mytilus edulis]|uniref:PIF1 n=1 Tax=Mytilus edulis TaxID=6550 RepID=A0A8S3TCE1_MYTED|nr:PIF1 [Mytilus edulis]
MLFHPWKNELQDIPNSYDFIMKIYTENRGKVTLKRQEYEKKRKVLDYVECLVNHEQNDQITTSSSEFMPGTDFCNEEDLDQEQTLAEKYGCFDPGKPMQYDIALDIGITRKQISDEDLHFKKYQNQNIGNGPIVDSSDRVRIIWVLFDDKNIGKQQRKHYRHLLKPGISTECTPIFEISCKCCVVNNPEYKFLRRQFPIRLSAAKTIHKSQGSTLETVAVHFGSRRKSAHAFSRYKQSKNMSGLNILALNEEKLAVSPEVILEMERMREDAQLSLSEYHKQ